MRVHELQAGDEVFLGGGVRLRVLAVEGDDVLLAVLLPQPPPLVGVEVPERRESTRAAPIPSPSAN
jgi:hypothetical protein